MSHAWENWKKYSGVLCDRNMFVKQKGKIDSIMHWCRPTEQRRGQQRNAKVKTGGE